MVEGSLDIKNLKAGDKITEDEECVAVIHIAVIKRKGSDILTPDIESDHSKGFRFRDLIRAIDKVKERLERMEPAVREQENLNRDVEEYLNKIGFKPDRDANRN